MQEETQRFNVAIIGTGPAGIFAALELSRLQPNLKILMLEKGPLRGRGDRDNKTTGWGGAGAFSDGKLDLTSEIGGNLIDSLGKPAFASLMQEAEAAYLRYCGPEETHVETEPNPERVCELSEQCSREHMHLIPFPVRHLGTDRAYDIVMDMHADLKKAGVHILTDCEVKKIEPAESAAPFTIFTEYEGKEKIFTAEHVVAATGREGDSWLWKEALRLGIPVERNRVDIGVRVEVRNDIFQHFTSVLHEPKIIYRTPCHGDRVRTFCVCPNGFVVKEQYRGLNVYTVNGESDSKRGRQSPNTNFAILVSQAFTEPFNDPTTYAASIARTANMLAGGDGVLVQRVDDIKRFRRSNAQRIRQSIGDGFIEPTLPEAVPGDLSLAIPSRHWCCILSMLDALNRIAPGIAGPHTLLYGPEVKFYSNKITATFPFETTVPGLYVAGDGSGNTRGLMQSSMMGMIVGRDIAKKL